MPADFFPTPDPSLDHIDPTILTSPLDDLPLDGPARYLGCLSLVTRVPQECFILDFAAETLRLLDFQGYHLFVPLRFAIPPTISGGADPVTQTGLLCTHPFLVLLVLITDKTLANEADADAQIVATAIEAFRFNNKMRGEHGLDPLDAMTIPCISMAITCPTFYLVPVTTALSNAVIGQRPPTQCQVLRCPTVTTCTAGIGLKDTEYRKLVLRRFLAFKALAKSHWVHILEGV